MRNFSIEQNLIKSDRCADFESSGIILELQEQLREEPSTLPRCHEKLRGIHRLWFQTLKNVLLGNSLIPVVEAAPKVEKPPEKPPRMRYKDLPIYESPHYEYKDYHEDLKKCPNVDVKLLQQYLFPKVRSYKKSWIDSISEFCKDAKDLKNDALSVVYKKKDELVVFLRSPDNLQVRQGIVAAGTALGYYRMSKSGSTMKKVVSTCIGALITGAACFPEETDEIFRSVSFQFAKCAVCAFNFMCGSCFVLRDRVPCKDAMPAIPPDRPANEKNKCDQKK